MPGNFDATHPTCRRMRDRQRFAVEWVEQQQQLFELWIVDSERLIKPGISLHP